jgi:hypothetical protein
MSDTPRPRYTLRDLPLPAKLVVSAFLLSVGLGYLSAMVQLHMKHSSREGDPLPTPADVIERFSGYKEFDGTYPKSKIEEIISGDPHGGFNKANMTPAFYGEDDKYKKKYSKLPAGDPTRKRVDAERDGERQALIAFINAPAGVRKEAYTADQFDLPAERKGKPVSEDFLADGTAVEDGKVKIQSLIGERCGRCHDKGQAPKFETFEQLEPLITAPTPETFESGGKVWVKSGLQMTEEGLTQSTHAHLLSFAVLFALTGFVYSFTTHHGLFRGLLGPIVLVAQVADVSCWWLARIDLPYGPLFAQTIMATGAVVGLGLMLQIVLSLFNMYGVKGKAVLVVLFIVAGGGFFVLYDKVIKPALEMEKARKETLNLEGKKEEPAQPPQPPADPPGRMPGKRGGNA